MGNNKVDEIRAGIINIRKDKGYTSFDVVAKLRNILHIRKMGHTGTLDPMAEGVLPVCIGAATKLCESFSDHEKEYVATFKLGEIYDTQDITGVMIEQREVMSTEEELRDAIKSFVGGYEQVPPMYSAKQVDGKRLYDIARSGKTIDRKAVFVEIHEIEVLDVNLPKATIRVRCGKGTYIRSLISDIGDKLGCGAVMESLVRTRVGDFDIKDAFTLDEVAKAVSEDNLDKVFLDAEKLFSDLKIVRTDENLSRLVHNGNYLNADDFAVMGLDPKSLKDMERVRVYDSDGRFVAVYEYKKSRVILKPYKMFM